MTEKARGEKTTEPMQEQNQRETRTLTPRSRRTDVKNTSKTAILVMEFDRDSNDASKMRAE